MAPVRMIVFLNMPSNNEMNENRQNFFSAFLKNIPHHISRKLQTHVTQSLINRNLVKQNAIYICMYYRRQTDI